MVFRGLFKRKSPTGERGRIFDEELKRQRAARFEKKMDTDLNKLRQKAKRQAEIESASGLGRAKIRLSRAREAVKKGVASKPVRAGLKGAAKGGQIARKGLQRVKPLAQNFGKNVIAGGGGSKLPSVIAGGGPGLPKSLESPGVPSFLQPKKKEVKKRSITVTIKE